METVLKLTQSCEFPWLLGNITMRDTKIPLGNGIPYEVFESFGLKIGVYGIAGDDWIPMLADEYGDDLIYEEVG